MESCKTIKRYVGSAVWRPTVFKGRVSSVVVRFHALKSMKFSYPEQTGLHVSLMGPAETYSEAKETATRLWTEEP